MAGRFMKNWPLFGGNNIRIYGPESTGFDQMERIGSEKRIRIF